MFLDTSALAERYVAELGSAKAVKVCRQADSLAICVICLPEFASTLARLVREKKITQSDYRMLKGHVMADLADIDICQLTPDILASGVTLLETNPLRAMDALHGACAIAMEADRFVSADHHGPECPHRHEPTRSPQCTGAKAGKCWVDARAKPRWDSPLGFWQPHIFERHGYEQKAPCTPAGLSEHRNENSHWATE